jgi:hypothetical protein
MKDKRWIDLYNCLYLASSTYEEVSFLESPVFEVLDELETRMRMGMSEDSLTYFLSEGLINDVNGQELAKFRDFVFAIDSKHWNPTDFNYYQDWKLVKDWAIALLKKLGIEKNGWNSDGEVVIYTE